MSTTLLKNGKIIDGTGAQAFQGHVLVEGDRISAVLKDGEPLPQADTIIDVNNSVVSPGFIDMHSHADWVLPLDDHQGLMRRFIEQGVTSVVGGNCGFSAAPLNTEFSEMPALLDILLDKKLDVTWKSMGEYLDRIDEGNPAVNLAELVGHASVRFAASDKRRGRMNPDDLNKCLDGVRRSFDEGACGLSLGLMYDPGIYSPLDELEAFCGVAAKADKPVTVHLKALSSLSQTYPITTMQAHNTLALKEMIDIARKTGAKLQVSHLIFVGRRSWSSAPKSIEIIEKARDEGVDVMVDAFPYTAGNTTINVLLPYWFLAKIPESYSNRWDRIKLRAEMEIGFRLVGFMYKDFQVMDAAIDGMEDLNGMTIEQIARKWNTGPFDALLRLSEESRGATLMLFHTYSGEPGNERAMELVMSRDYCLFETDAAIKSRGYPNPAAMGTFPRILGVYSRDRKQFTMENAVKRMTSASAERFGIKDRGIISNGKAADIVVFDEKEICDTPPVGTEPAGKPKGIQHVFINGQHVVNDGDYISSTGAGKVLK